MAVDTPKGIVQSFKYPLWAVRSTEMHRLIEDLRQFEGAADCYAFGSFARLKLNPSGDDSGAEMRIRAYLDEKKHRQTEMQPAEATIEDCFIEYMKH